MEQRYFPQYSMGMMSLGLIPAQMLLKWYTIIESRYYYGVCITTSNNLCLMELNYPSLSARIKASQQRFLGNLLKHRHGTADDPFFDYTFYVCFRICPTLLEHTIV